MNGFTYLAMIVLCICVVAYAVLYLSRYRMDKVKEQGRKNIELYHKMMDRLNKQKDWNVNEEYK